MQNTLKVSRDFFSVVFNFEHYRLHHVTLPLPHATYTCIYFILIKREHVLNEKMQLENKNISIEDYWTVGIWYVRFVTRVAKVAPYGQSNPTWRYSIFYIYMYKVSIKYSIIVSLFNCCKRQMRVLSLHNGAGHFWNARGCLRYK